MFLVFIRHLKKTLSIRISFLPEVHQKRTDRGTKNRRILTFAVKAFRPAGNRHCIRHGALLRVYRLTLVTVCVVKWTILTDQNWFLVSETIVVRIRVK